MTAPLASTTMTAMALYAPHAPLVMETRPMPAPGPGEIRLKVEACGVCRTDLHVVDGELTKPKCPIVPGHEIVGRVDALGAGVTALRLGERVGVPWLAHLRALLLLRQRPRKSLR